MYTFLKCLLVCTLLTATSFREERPTLYIIGDSTVKNGKGKGDGNLWGWGSFLPDYFDTTKLAVRNYALGGRSSRTFITEGHWDQVLVQLKAGDYVILQFGHNDGGALDDTARARGTIKGTGEETKDIYNPIMKKAETVHTYGWYMRKYVADIKAKGATAIICSPIPRDMFTEGKVLRASGDYGKWAEETATVTGAYFIDLNASIADEYDKLGPDKVKEFFPGDHTHTNEAGARLNATAVAAGMRKVEGLGGLLVMAGSLPAQQIDRKALVTRHNVVNTAIDALSSLSVGNGRFAFTVDVTGLQSFPEQYDKGVPLGTESEWGWHSFTDTSHFRFGEALKTYAIHGRKVSYAVQWSVPERNKKAADWFRQNLHRLQLGNIGFELTKKDGTVAVPGDLGDIRQELDLWTGEIRSHFTLEGIPVDVSTVAHPEQDGVAVKVHSPLLQQGRLKVRVRFPYPTGAFADDGDNWKHPEAHRSVVVSSERSGAGVNGELSGVLLRHDLDTTRYFLRLKWSGEARIQEWEPHYFLVNPGIRDAFSFTGIFSAGEANVPAYDEVLAASAGAWADYWQKGAVVDFSGSTDSRAFELERRVILSQYLLRVQEAGDYPPQETGLTYNSWYGKPHLEMHWWHAAHFALWGHPELLERSLDWYSKVLGEAKGIAERQGYKGVRWQKMTDPAGRESPSSVGAFLVWQQPHFIYLTELCYRAEKSRAVLEKYKDLVFATADFMASYAWYDAATRRYILGKGLIPAQERFREDSTFNPCFELAYWRWALATAQQWRVRLGLGPDTSWQRVEQRLAALPQGDVQNADGVQRLYFPTESAADAYTNPRYRTDHPAVLATYGFLPATRGLDTAMMHATFNWIDKNWSWEDTWGWDFPLTAMSATRLGLPDKAIDALLMPVGKNRYLPDGHNYQDERLRCYLPGNGGLLSAIALMCAGYDGAGRVDPGIPSNGKWKVRWEGLSPMP